MGFFLSAWFCCRKLFERNQVLDKAISPLWQASRVLGFVDANCLNETKYLARLFHPCGKLPECLVLLLQTV
ncbi:MAG: hypothetical protein RIS29_2844 [Bacteroidota bacterium]